MCCILSGRRNRSHCHAAHEELTCNLNRALSRAKKSYCSHHDVFLSEKMLDKMLHQVIFFFLRNEKILKFLFKKSCVSMFNTIEVWFILMAENIINVYTLWNRSFNLKNSCETFYSESCLLNLYQEIFWEPSQYFMQQQIILYSLKPEARGTSFGGAVTRF